MQVRLSQAFPFQNINLEFDYAELPAFILEAMNPAMKVNNIKYTNANISFGYAYNWVFARNCLACLSLTPAIAYKASDVDAETHEGKTWYGNFNLDFLIRAGVVYNNGKYFVGTSFVGKNYNYHRNNFHWTTGSERFRYTSDSISIYARSIEEKYKIKDVYKRYKVRVYICSILLYRLLIQRIFVHLPRS